jgi:acyl-CoA reductase-like NAD-dependent aldehyde dehydrogenase
MLSVEGVELHPGHWVGGERVRSASGHGGRFERFEVFSPIDQTVLGELDEGGAALAGQAVSAGLDAFEAWAALGATGRKPYLDRLADEIGRRADDFCRLESRDAGVLLSRMRHGVVPRSMLNLRWFAEQALGLQDRSLHTEQAEHRIRHDPAGVAVVITPWNSPLLLATWKLGPALAAGNTCVLKPPEWAPLTGALLGACAEAAGLPPGVLNIVQGSGAGTGDALIRDPRVARVSFTGSVGTARRIAQATGANLVPCSLELGGKSAFIVLEDADLDAAAGTAALMYRNAGQVCLAGTRLLVHESLAEAFVAKLRAIVEQLVVGDPREAATEIGPLIHPRQLERVQGYIQRAVAQGAHCVWGGQPHARGALYHEPTLIAGMQPGAEIVQEEVFGPVLTLQTFASDDEAVAMANSTDYGLGGVCYGEEAHAAAVAERVRTGFIWVNSFGIRDLAAPFGGIKRSGIGREGGDWSFDFFCNVKDVVLPKKPFVASFSHR